jgi:hypothetical protein
MVKEVVRENSSQGSVNGNVNPTHAKTRGHGSGLTCLMLRRMTLLLTKVGLDKIGYNCPSPRYYACPPRGNIIPTQDDVYYMRNIISYFVSVPKMWGTVACHCSSGGCTRSTLSQSPASLRYRPVSLHSWQPPSAWGQKWLMKATIANISYRTK